MPEKMMSNLEGPLTIESSESILLQVGDNILEISDAGITITVGDNVVEISDVGVTITGTTVEILGDAETTITSPILTVLEG